MSTAPPTQPAAGDGVEDPAATPTPRPRRPLRYVALGDSLSSGMDGIDGGRSYPDAYAQLLRRRTGRKVALTNLGVPGWNSTDLLNALRHDTTMRDAVAAADIVTWDIGGNDLIEAAARSSMGACEVRQCLDDAHRTFVQNWSAIVDELVSLRRSPRVRLRVIDLYTPFATVRGVYKDEALAALAAMNAVIHAEDGRRGVRVADVSQAFTAASSRQLIDEDRLHPTAAGHRLIAQQLLAVD